MVAVTDFMAGTYLLMATCRGEIKKTAADKFAAVRSSGLIAIDLEEGDELVAACLATDQDDVILVTQKGQAIRFAVSELRATSRTSGGVRGIRLVHDDQVVGMVITYPNAFVLVVTTEGFGKLTPVSGYPRQHRAGGGVRTFKLIGKTDEVADARVISPSQQLMVISADGIVLCTPAREEDPRKGITIQGRSTQGVRLMRLGRGDRVVAITCFDRDEDSKGQKIIKQAG
jgi:DNA gyrase subunit A